MALAQHKNGSMLRVRLSDGSPLTLAVDGRYYQKHNTTLTVGDLPPGRHSIKVYSFMPYSNSRGGKAILLYRGTLRIEPETFVSCVVNSRGERMRVHVSDLESKERFDEDMSPVDTKEHAHLDGYKPDVDNSLQQPKNEPRKDDIYDNGPAAGKQQIAALKKEVAAKNTDTDKLKLLKERMRDMKYNTAQVRVMMGWLNFESSKVELAKYAYKKVTDKKNYAAIEDDFSLTSSKEEIQQLIRK
jgi:hypothetical protein